METNNNNEKLYAIRIDRVAKFKPKKAVYVEWCNNHWYGTTDDPTPKFTYKEVREIADNIKHHYVLKLTVINQEGVLDPMDLLHRGRLTEHTIPIKKSLFNLNGVVFSSKKNNYFK